MATIGDKNAPAKTTRRGQRGFSLIETLISSSILLIAVAGAVAAITAANAEATHQRKMSHAINIGEATMEELLLAFGSDTTRIGAGAHGPRCFNKYAVRQPCNGTELYQSTWLVAANVLPAVPGIRRVKVTVSWEEQGRKKNIQMATVRN